MHSEVKPAGHVTDARTYIRKSDREGAYIRRQHTVTHTHTHTHSHIHTEEGGRGERGKGKANAYMRSFVRACVGKGSMEGCN
mmetsp:Transcript_4495/g.11921  ORF Transcript_4495/g.11921 Transcript_4495/m.11921 type:complete len:82 (-) Transcript_4495:255-500(-)